VCRLLVPLGFMLLVFSAPTLAGGRSDYKAHCAGCRGAYGYVQTEKAKVMGVDVRTLSLTISKLNRAEVIRVIEKGRNGIPGFGKTLTKAQIAGIADYVMALRKR
jgi:mono/diheme cytochrome c family protein